MESFYSFLLCTLLLNLFQIEAFSLAGNIASFGPNLKSSPGRLDCAPLGLRMGNALEEPERAKPFVAGTPLPRVYVYDHCPFCVRVRFVLGLKNIKHNVIFLANDDVETPTKLVGKKVVPILEMPFSGEVMKESMDIVKRLDQDPAFGQPILKPASGRTDLTEWQEKHGDVFRLIQRPRYVTSGILPEFSQQAGRDAYIRNHPLPPYEKAEWQDRLSRADRYASYTAALSRTAELIPQANQALLELEGLIASGEACTGGGLSYDDVDLFGRLRSLTLIRGLLLPPKVAAYLDTMSRRADLCLYYPVAH